MIEKSDRFAAAAVEWAQLLPVVQAHPIVPPADDPVSAAAAAGMADWPVLHETMAAERMVNAAKLIGQDGTTNAAIEQADGANATDISSI